MDSQEAQHTGQTPIEVQPPVDITAIGNRYARPPLESRVTSGQVMIGDIPVNYQLEIAPHGSKKAVQWGGIYNPDTDVILAYIGVPEESRGKGLGFTAMNAIESEVRDQGKRRIVLTPADWGHTEQLIRFYRRCGYGFVDIEGSQVGFKDLQP